MTSDHINNVRIRFHDPYNPIQVVLLMIIALCAFQVQLTSNPDGGHIGFRQYGGPGGSFVLAPVKNRKRMVQATYMPNMVLLEESEPTLYILP